MGVGASQACIKIIYSYVVLVSQLHCIYIYIYVCVCMCIRVRICISHTATYVENNLFMLYGQVPLQHARVVLHLEA